MLIHFIKSLQYTQIINDTHIFTTSYMYDHHHNNLPKALSNTFKSMKYVNSHLTRRSKSHKLIFPPARTTVYDINNITHQSIKTTQGLDLFVNSWLKHFLDKCGS